jgi:hypothetical protein
MAIQRPEQFTHFEAQLPGIKIRALGCSAGPAWSPLVSFRKLTRRLSRTAEPIRTTQDRTFGP